MKEKKCDDQLYSDSETMVEESWEKSGISF